MEDLKAFLASEFKKLHEQLDQVNARLDKVESIAKENNIAIATIYTEQKEIARVVQQTATDVLDNQIEHAARNNLTNEKIRGLEETAFRLEKTTLHLKKRMDGLEQQINKKANEQ
jgi:hypothetical protein